MLILIIVISIMFLLQYQKKHKKFIDQQNNFQQTLLQSQLEIQEKTLKNISQEIHDNIGQVLSLVKLNLYTMDINDIESVFTKIDTSKELVSKAIVDLRDLSHSMNTDYIEEKGLVKAIEYELEMIKKTGVIKPIFKIIGLPIRLTKERELIILRIVQEALQNIIKHSGAGKLKVKLIYSEEVFKLVIIDNGQGFDSDNFQNSSRFGIGMNQMASKSKTINSSLSVNSKKGVGTVIQISIPY